MGVKKEEEYRYMENENVQFDKIAEEYDENLKVLLGKWGDSDIDKFAEYKIALARQLLRGNIDSVLDFGCGIGRSLSYFKTYFHEAELYGCDVSAESLKLAAREIQADHLFVNAEYDSISKFGASYSLVFIACVLHHIEPKERLRWMKEVFTSVKPGGYIIVFEHNTLNPMTKSIILDDNNLVDDISWMLSHKYLKELMLSIGNGARIAWDGYTLFSPVWFKGILRMERCLKWLPIGAQHCILLQKCEEIR